MKINFQTACQLVAKEHNYNTWEELLADNEAHAHYYQLAADRYAEHQNTNNQLQKQVLEWASSKYLLSKDNCLKQFAKFISEAGELGDAIIKDDRPEVIDAIGDVQVTLIILCDQLDLNYDECLQSAYNVISKRTGSTINGTFIKD